MFKYKFENSILPDETVHGSREFLRSKDIQVRSFTLPEFRARGGIPISIHRLLSLPSAIYIRPAETRPSFAFLRTRGSASQKSRREEEEEGGGRRKFPSFLPSIDGRLGPNVTDPPSRGDAARFPRIIILLSYNSSNSWDAHNSRCMYPRLHPMHGEGRGA